MKINFDKIILYLKIAASELKDERKHENLKNKIKIIINEVEKIKIQNKKDKKDKKNKDNFNFISKNPEKSIGIIEDLIYQEEKNLEKRKFE